MFDNLFVLAGPIVTAAMLVGGLVAVVGLASTPSPRGSTPRIARRESAPR